jgi:hypothetical protein
MTEVEDDDWLEHQGDERAYSGIVDWKRTASSKARIPYPDVRKSALLNPIAQTSEFVRLGLGEVI